MTISAARIALVSILLFVTLQATTPAPDYYPPPDSQGGWRSVTGAKEDQFRAAAGMDRKKLDEAFEYAQTTSQHGGLLVARHGWLVYERYYGRGNREANPDMASCGKAFTSISCGILLKEKHDQIPNGLDEKVFTEKYLPEAFPLSDPAKADIRLGHLLAMSSGMHENSSAAFVRGERVKTAATTLDRSLDIDQSALRTPLWCKPGEGYSYASGSPHIASIVLRHLVGMEMQEYINEKLAKPMQFGRWGYAMRRNGVLLAHTPGGGSIALRSTDALRFAYLLLHKGRWQGQQLVPRRIRRALRQAVAVQSALPIQPPIRGERRWARGRSAARRILEIRRGWIRDLCRAVARSLIHLQDGGHRETIRSHAHRPSGALQIRWIARQLERHREDRGRCRRQKDCRIGVGGCPLNHLEPCRARYLRSNS